MHELNCLRCGETMRALGQEELQLGKAGLLLGSLPNALAGAIRVSVCECPRCGKLEFFRVPEAQEAPEASGTPQVICPRCGCRHDFDWPRCPNCGHPRYTGR